MEIEGDNTPFDEPKEEDGKTSTEEEGGLGVLVTEIKKKDGDEDDVGPPPLTEQEMKTRRAMMKKLEKNLRKMARIRAEVAQTDWFKGPNEMDDQTRHAHFESLRSMPGVTRLKPSRNKKLYIVHKDLQRQCDKEVRRHQFDARVTTSEINRQQQLVQKKQETLHKQRNKCYATSERTRNELDRAEHSHEVAESKKINAVPMRTTHASIVRAIEKLEMPRAMKEKLQMQTYTTRIVNEA
ncbi:hypothetical protein CAPTEDRAFT_197181 [Capitella teleta]|uniref:Uncharacterized protein n=1 Tax=Capitella teleta TaxID=283909 RepID=R7UL22_CAPTE|nr:hypothetical protein CAPTEDRAFT_197181 [Capitella teleta]|eukprot:ELU03927.1 hypothetical protein CAPTEDRAFT_197181 [Capitella teleta]